MQTADYAQNVATSGEAAPSRPTPSPKKSVLWTGRVLSALPALMMVLSAAMKISRSAIRDRVDRQARLRRKSTSAHWPAGVDVRGLLRLSPHGSARSHPADRLSRWGRGDARPSRGHVPDSGRSGRARVDGSLPPRRTAPRSHPASVTSESTARGSPARRISVRNGQERLRSERRPSSPLRSVRAPRAGLRDWSMRGRVRELGLRTTSRPTWGRSADWSKAPRR